MRAVPLLVLFIAASALSADTFKPTEFEKGVVDLTNKAREEHGLPALKMNARLFAAARAHAANMAKQGKMEHKLDGKTHGDRIDAAGYKWASAFENIAYDFKTPKDVVDGWMGSEHHRENILQKEVTEIGVGTATRDNHIYIAQVFAHELKPPQTLRFTMENATGQALTIDMGSEKPAELPAKGKSGYSLTTTEIPPLATLKSEGMNELSVLLEDGGSYVIGKKGSSFTVSSPKK